MQFVLTASSQEHKTEEMGVEAHEQQERHHRAVWGKGNMMARQSLFACNYTEEDMLKSHKPQIWHAEALTLQYLFVQLFIVNRVCTILDLQDKYSKNECVLPAVFHTTILD